MDLRQLRFLVRAVESSSISRAANALGIAQPSLSQQLKNLEDELGAVLLHRTPSGILPTETGLMVADRARAILRLADNLLAEVRAANAAPSGEVLVGLPTTMALHLTVPLVQSIQHDFPNIALRISEGMSGHIQEWLLSGRLDIAILYTDEAIAGLTLEKIADEDLCLISRAGGAAGAIPFSALENIALVLPGPGHGLRRSIERARARAQVQLKIAVEVDSLPHLKRLAMDGMLHTILPEAACREEIKSGQLIARPLTKPMARRPIVLATPQQRPPSIASQAVITRLRALIVQALGLTGSPAIK